MINKIKYILFDFSENFKNDFISTLKKTILFLIIGIVLSCIGSTAEIGHLILIIFGFLWGINLARPIFLALSIPNVVLKWVVFGFLAAICAMIGFFYFAWCIIKFIVYCVKSKPEA